MGATHIEAAPTAATDTAPVATARLRLVPITFAQACAFVEAHHRHHRPPRGHKYSTGIAAGDVLVGVAMVGRPVARLLDDGHTLEVVRLATDGTANACSKLYAAAWTAAKALGYRRLVTYTQAGESGASLRAAGWHVVANLSPAPGWSRPSQPAPTTAPPASPGIAGTPPPEHHPPPHMPCMAPPGRRRLAAHRHPRRRLPAHCGRLRHDR